MSVSLTRELHFRGSGPPKSIQKPPQNPSKKRPLFKVKRVPKWVPNHTKKRPETTLKKRIENERNNDVRKTCLSKWTGSALIFHLLRVKSERFHSVWKRPSLRSLARCARSLAALATRFPIIPINSVRNPKRPIRIPYKFRTKSTQQITPNSLRFRNQTTRLPQEITTNSSRMSMKVLRNFSEIPHHF